MELPETKAGQIVSYCQPAATASTSTNNNALSFQPKEGKYHITSSNSNNERLPEFDCTFENIYLGDKRKRVNKEIRRMSCDCTYNPDEHDFNCCGEDCLNRLLLIECNSKCPCGEFCSNRKFQEGQKVRVDAFKTLKKGWGLRTLEDIAANQFVIEYCGEVMGYDEFESRVETYDKENRQHYYFMTLRADEIIDATHKGNLSRFINHSCSPNCETQKWTVNGYLRIGFFSTKDIKAGSELTFDYKFQRYGKKAQVCYCESPNCRGIIGGEKHTPLKSIISGRAASPVPTSSPRRNRRRRLAEQYDDKPLELEIAQLLAGEKGIKGDEQALKLSQFMVRAETQTQRLLLLDALSATEDQNCLRSFVRYQGMSLLWSWMVDLADNSLHIQKKMVQVLKHLPVANLNQVKDTKVLKVVNKWARKPSVTCIPEEETSSASDIDSQRLSPLELPDDATKREAAISSSSSDMDYTSTISTVDNTTQDSSDSKDTESVPSDLNTIDNFALVTEERPLLVTVDKDSENVFNEAKGTVVVNSDGQQIVTPCPTGLVSDVRTTTMDLSEEDSRWSEDDCTSTDSDDLTDMAAELLDSWRHLKEVYRIPKKSTIVEKQEPESTSGAAEAVVTEASQIREEHKILTIPTIDGDLFQEDEFLSKLGEREPEVIAKAEPQPLVSLGEIQPLMGNTVVTTQQHPDEVPSNDNTKPSIHQRLQMVAGNAAVNISSGGSANAGVSNAGTSNSSGAAAGNVSKQNPVWHGKSNPGVRKTSARKHPYQGPMTGAFQQRAPERWSAARNQDVNTMSRYNHPGTVQQPNHQDVGATPLARSNMVGAAPWVSQQATPSYPGGYQQYQQAAAGGAGGGVHHSAGITNLNQARTQQSYYGQAPAQNPGGLVDPNVYQSPYTASHIQPEHQPYASRQLPSQGVPTNVQNYPEMQQQSINQPMYPSLPPFDPSKPPPNFAAPTSTQHQQQQYPNTMQTQYPANPTPPFQNTPPGYAPGSNPNVIDVQSYRMQQTQNQPPVVSQEIPRSVQAEPLQGIGNQVPGSSAENTSMVSSTVRNETGTLERLAGTTDPWPSAEQYSKPHDAVLPPDWRKAFDGEGRAYYYHVRTRQTQWEPPTADRSPPTPELGYHGDELDSSNDMASFSSHMTQDVAMEIVHPVQKKKPKTPSTPPGSPPKSPVLMSTTAAADTTDVRKGLYSPSLLLQGRHLTQEQVKRRETFRMKLSAVVVNYLNPYHKVDCKVGRISSVDDFKFLARKLTHGVMVKELSRLKDESVLACNDSVKIKTKEYIRNYMQKFGPVYKAS